MQAKSLLGSARTIDRRLEALLSANLLADGPEPWAHAVAIRATLGDVAEQLRASVPLPAASDDPDPGDERFFRLLDVVAGDEPTPERAAESLGDDAALAGESSPTGGDPPASGCDGEDPPASPRDGPDADGADGPLASLRAADRVEVRGSRLVVPLGDDPAGRNWWAVLAYLRESVADLAAKADRVHSRMVVTDADGLLVDAWDSVAERLDVLEEVLEAMTANGRYAGRSVNAGDGPTEFVAWTADQFGRDA